jgi:alkylation response protein AidB-like acyl-CoA dehydrogenase
MQIWGGHGYIKQNNMEQIVRDARIAPVWEGTTGIQACHGTQRSRSAASVGGCRPLHA